MLSSNPSVGFTNAVTSYSNNVLTCSFTRSKTFSGFSNFFDLNNQYYLLTSSGSLSSGGITRHTSAQSSSSTFDLLVDGEYTTGLEVENKSKVKAHACLMVCLFLIHFTFFLIKLN